MFEFGPKDRANSDEFRISFLSGKGCSLEGFLGNSYLVFGGRNYSYFVDITLCVFLHSVRDVWLVV